MTWTPYAVRQLRTSRRESQGAFASALKVDRTTVSGWERGKVEISPLNAAALDDLARGSRDTSRDYERGVLYACEAMSETIARLLRQQRKADEATVKQTAKAMLADSPPASGSSRPETGPAARRTTSPRGGSASGSGARNRK